MIRKRVILFSFFIIITIIIPVYLLLRPEPVTPDPQEVQRNIDLLLEEERNETKSVQAAGLSAYEEEIFSRSYPQLDPWPSHTTGSYLPEVTPWNTGAGTGTDIGPSSSINISPGPSSSTNPSTNPSTSPVAGAGTVTPEVQKSMINILFLGISKTDARNGEVPIYRTDAISLASINTATNRVNMICIPKDTYVYIPIINKYDRINHAYIWGGMGENGIKSTISAVDDFIRYSKVTYYFAIDMEPIAEIIDSIGGVEINVDTEISANGVTLSKGLQLLNGRQAETYINWRYSGNGDLDRVIRQQQLLRALFMKIKQTSELTDTISMLFKYGGSIKTDMGFLELMSMESSVGNITLDDIETHIVPGTARLIDGISYWIPDQKGTDEMLRQIFLEDK